MGRHKININEHGDKYRYASKYTSILEEDLASIDLLVKQGNEIKWSDNEHYCTVAEKTFNVHKQVYEAHLRDLNGVRAPFNY